VIRVGVLGATGRMGREVCRAVAGASDLVLAAAVSRSAAGRRVADVLDIPSSDVILSDRLDTLVGAGAEVAVDFTSASFAPDHVAWAIEHKIHIVVGTTGFEIDPAWGRQREVGVFVASNFAIGAVLMMRFAAEAARFLPAAEVVELHHDGKTDAPSGTALETARRIGAASGGESRGGASSPDPATADSAARGTDVDGVRIHSVRLPGLLAHQEVIFGAPGQTLSIRHDSTDRAAFVPGVLMAIEAVPGRPGLTVGLDALLEGRG
jgi:4-hydroxy-tetrahydrodipicolinate reductase